MPENLYPALRGNATKVKSLLITKLEDSVFSGEATIIYRNNLFFAGADEDFQPAIVAVFSGDVVLMPTPAPTMPPVELSSQAASGKGSAQNSSLLVGVIVGVALFLLCLSPLTFILARKCRGYEKSVDKVAKPDDLRELGSLDHAVIHNKDDGNELTNVARYNSDFAENDAEKEKQRFESYHAMYTNAVPENQTVEEDDKDSEADSFDFQDEPAVASGEDLLKTPAQESKKKEKSSFFKFGADAVLSNQSSFDISDFYPRSMSFDVEFAAINSKAILNAEKEAKASRFPINTLAISQDEGLPSSKSDKAKELGDTLPAASSNNPPSKSPTNKGAVSNNSSTTKSPTNKGAASSNSSSTKTPTNKGADRSAEEEEVAETTSPHSAQFKAIRNKFQTMIEKNNKALTLAPLSLPSTPNNKSNNNSPSPTPGNHRRFSSDGHSARNKID